MKFLIYKLISNSSNKKFRGFFTYPEFTWMPAAPKLGAQFYFFLQVYNIKNKTFLFYKLIPNSMNKK